MSLSYQGKIGVAAIVPTSVTCVAAASASLALILPQIAVDLAGAVTLEGMLSVNPPTITLNLSATANLLADMNVALTASAPTATFQLSAILTLIAQISPIVASISASLSLTLPMVELLGTGGIQAFSFSGTGAEFGSLVNGELANEWPDGTPAGATVSAFVLASTANSTWTGLQTFFTSIPASQPTHSFEFIGNLSIGAMCGGLSQGLLSANLNLEAQLSAITAELTGALNLKALLTASPPTLSASINIVAELAASLNAYLSVGGFGSITVLFDAVVSLVLSLTALVAQLEASIALLVDITTALATAGVLCFTYTGTATAFGPALTSALASGWPDGTAASAATNALVLGATTSLTAAGLGTFLSGI